MKQPIAEFRKHRNEFERRAKELLEQFTADEYVEGDGIAKEEYYPYYFNTPKYGGWYLNLDTRDDEDGGVGCLRSLWAHTRFSEKNDLTPSTNSKWNTCFFQTTNQIKEPFGEHDVHRSIHLLERMLHNVGFTTPHIPSAE